MGQRPPGPGASSFPSGVIAPCGEQEVFLKHRRMSTRRTSVELPFVTASVCAVQNKALMRQSSFAGVTDDAHYPSVRPTYNSEFFHL